MTLYFESKQPGTPPLIGRLVLASLLIAPGLSFAALTVPQRPGAASPPASSARYKSTARSSRPYLVMVGPSVLRFSDPEVMPSEEPTLPPPPKPKVTADPAAHISSATGPSDPTGNTPRPLDSDLPTANSTPAPDSTKPVSILPDDTQREIRAEEVLPFFQFPGGNDAGVIAIPITVTRPQGPAAPPPSSATYRQQ